MAVFTKYDVLVESLKPPERNTGTSASQIDPHVLSLAEDKLCEMIAPFEKLGFSWVKVSGLHILPFVLSAKSN